MDLELNRNLDGISDVAQLSNEITYRRYLMTKDRVGGFFHELSVPEYVLLCITKKIISDSGESGRKVYLCDVAAKMQLNINQVSKIVRHLNEKGYLKWSHDGDGSDGTYITVTEAGEHILRKQEGILKEFYGRVIEKFGKEHLLELLKLMNQLEMLMQEEMEGEAKAWKEGT